MNANEWTRRVEQIRRLAQNGLPTCPVCRQSFEPTRPGQIHDRPSCVRVPALQQGQQGDLLETFNNDAA